MKNFNDLEFTGHPYGGAKASMDFDNGYGVSVITGIEWYSNGTHLDYELAIVKGSELVYGDLTNGDVLGYLSKDDVTDIMKKVQELEPDSYPQELEEA